MVSPGWVETEAAVALVKSLAGEAARGLRESPRRPHAADRWNPDRQTEQGLLLYLREQHVRSTRLVKRPFSALNGR
jgi:hypothetical protein